MKQLLTFGLAIACFAAFSLSSFVEDADAKVRISERTKYYTVTGSTGRQLFKSITRRGPRKGHAIATTRSLVQVKNMKFAKRGSRCVVSSADVIVNLTYTLPRWKGSRRASPKLRRNWEGFSRLVKKHEDTHGRITREYARRLHKKVLGFTGRVSRGCADFGKRSQRALKLLQKGHRARHVRFDRREGRARSRVRRLQKAVITTQ